MKLTIFFLLLIFTLNREERNVELNVTVNKEFSEPFIGHLNVLDTDSFTREIIESEKKEKEKQEQEQEQELIKIVGKIRKFKFLGDVKKEEMEYKIEGNEIFGESEKNYNEIWEKILNQGEYYYENLFNVTKHAYSHLSGKWEKITIIYHKSLNDTQHLNSITVF